MAEELVFRFDPDLVVQVGEGHGGIIAGEDGQTGEVNRGLFQAGRRS